MRHLLLPGVLAFASISPDAARAQDARPLRVIVIPFGDARRHEESTVGARQIVTVMSASLPAGFRLVRPDWVQTVMSESGLTRTESMAEMLELAQLLRADIAVGVSVEKDSAAIHYTPTIVFRRDTSHAHAVAAARGRASDSVAALLARELVAEFQRRVAARH